MADETTQCEHCGVTINRFDRGIFVVAGIPYCSEACYDEMVDEMFKDRQE